jgi:hypothetical protein
MLQINLKYILGYLTQDDMLQIHPFAYEFHKFIVLMYHIFCIHSSVEGHLGSYFIPLPGFPSENHLFHPPSTCSPTIHSCFLAVALHYTGA